MRTFNIEMQALADVGQIRSKPVRNVHLSPLYAIVGQYWTNFGQYICATGDRRILVHHVKCGTYNTKCRRHCVVSKYHKISRVCLDVLRPFVCVSSHTLSSIQKQVYSWKSSVMNRHLCSSTIQI